MIIWFQFPIDIVLTRNIFKKDNRRRLNRLVFDNLQTTMNTFSEALYFLHVEVMANLDHYKSIELESKFPSKCGSRGGGGQGVRTPLENHKLYGFL